MATTLQTEDMPHDVNVVNRDEEWCDLCSPEPGGDGSPQRVHHRSIEQEILPIEYWDPAWGPGILHEVTWLVCGHTISRPC